MKLLLMKKHLLRLFYNSTASRGALILDTVYGEVKIGVHRDGAGYACEVLRKLKDAAK